MYVDELQLYETETETETESLYSRPSGLEHRLSLPSKLKTKSSHPKKNFNFKVPLHTNSLRKIYFSKLNNKYLYHTDEILFGSTIQNNGDLHARFFLLEELSQ